MNCQEFESVAFELARTRLIDAAARESATAHADSCGACAKRLRRERALTNALRGVGAGTREAGAPPRVEAALLAAFRERRVAAPPSTVAAPPSTIETARAARAITFSVRPRVTARAPATAAVAASLLLALAAAWRASAPQGAGVNSQGGQSVASDVRQPGKDEPAAKQFEQHDLTGIDEQHDLTVIEAKGVHESRVASRVPRQATRRRVEAVENLPVSFKVDGGQVSSGAGESASSAQAAPQGADASASSDFVRLATGDGSAPLESGQMVRVQVPRAALAALGLPVNAERAGELVKADILLAHDGTARAVRLRP